MSNISLKMQDIHCTGCEIYSTYRMGGVRVLQSSLSWLNGGIIGGGKCRPLSSLWFREGLRTNLNIKQWLVLYSVSDGTVYEIGNSEFNWFKEYIAVGVNWDFEELIFDISKNEFPLLPSLLPFPKPLVAGIPGRRGIWREELGSESVRCLYNHQCVSCFEL